MKPSTLAACVTIIAALIIGTCGCTASSNTTTSSMGTLSADNLAGAINDLYTSKNYTENTPFTMTKAANTITYHGVVTDGPNTATPYKRNATVVLTTDRTAAFAAYQSAIDAQEAQGFQEFTSSNASQNVYWVGYFGPTFSVNPLAAHVRIDLHEPTSKGLILGGEHFEYLNNANVGDYYQVLTDQQTLAATTPSANAEAGTQAASTTLTVHISKTDLYLGDIVTVSGTLTDANGQGVPDQPIHLKARATALGQTVDYPMNDTKTDSAGQFAGSGPVTASNVPSFVTQATVELWAVYDGNQVYGASASNHVTFTVHFSSNPNA